mmetsp:Transcript_7516/g.18630  ORF Transcript_7516/g.18630 Transcript_7516/m.18630 type:complete len:225 (-) Transcript_7516:614-1288(-)
MADSSVLPPRVDAAAPAAVPAATAGAAAGFAAMWLMNADHATASTLTYRMRWEGGMSAKLIALASGHTAQLAHSTGHSLAFTSGTALSGWPSMIFMPKKKSAVPAGAMRPWSSSSLAATARALVGAPGTMHLSRKPNQKCAIGVPTAALHTSRRARRAKSYLKVGGSTCAATCLPAATPPLRALVCADSAMVCWLYCASASPMMVPTTPVATLVSRGCAASARL